MKFKQKRPLKILLLCLAAFLLFSLIAFSLSWAFIDWDETGAQNYPGGIVLRDSNGEIIRVTLGEDDIDCRPTYVADKDDWIVKAIVAVEDGDFWNHRGVRPLSIARAFFQNLLYRRRISGASTITMQTVRLIRPHKKGYAAKWREAFEAMKMERSHDKLWIISQYLNRAPFGSNYVGIEAASHGWFGKSAKELGPAEAAMLAAMVQAPSRLRPDRERAGAMKRRNYVLERMRLLGYLDDEIYEGAKKAFPSVRRATRPFLHPYYTDWFLSELKNSANKEEVRQTDIITPLNTDIQEICERVVEEAANAGGWSVAAVVVKIGSKEESWADKVIALACSGDYFDKSSGQVNTAIAPRPAGSSLKPLLAALALDLGIVSPDERLKDIPLAYKGYRPANFDSRHRGVVTLREALILSLNIPFITMLEKVGLERFGSTLRASGFNNMNEPNERFGLGMAIGNVEISLLELVKAYAAFARSAAGDEKASPYSPGSAYIVSDYLSGAERSASALGHIADIELPRFAWKTGTSSAYRDAWTVAWNPEYAIGVWAGHKRGGFGDKTLVGAQAAAPQVWRILRSLYPSGRGPWFARPEMVETRDVCPLTGRLASPQCPESEEGWFIRGHSSPSFCAAHRVGYSGAIETVDTASGIARGEKLAIMKPENGAKFVLVEGMNQQAIVAKAIGCKNDCVLWWFLDSCPVARSLGANPVVIEMERGEHVLTCSDASGETSTVTFTVE